MIRRSTPPSLLKPLLWIIGIILTLLIIANLWTEILWFQEINYLSALLIRLKTQGILWLIIGSFSLFYLLGNIRLAQRWKWSDDFEDTTDSRWNGNLPQNNHAKRKLYPQSPPLRLRWLILITGGLASVIGLIVLHYSNIVLQLWHTDFNLPTITPPLPSPLAIRSISQIIPQLAEQFWKVGLWLGLLLLLFTFPYWGLMIIAVGMSLIFAVVFSENWTRIIQFFSPTPFNITDPVFNKDISFFVFKLPIFQLIDFWLWGLFLYGLIAVSLIYLLSGNSLSQGKFIGFTSFQLRHLYAMGSFVMATLALRHVLERYNLLYSTRGVVYGAGYTDIRIQLPVETLLAIIATSVAIWLIWKAIMGVKIIRSPIKKQPRTLWLVLSYFIIVIAGMSITIILQQIDVKPNELAREKPYIEYSIKFTRSAFALNEIDSKIFEPKSTLTLEDIKKNNLTIDNIRLWDTRPLLETNRQLQQIRLYYKFVDADIDRYLIEHQFSKEKPEDTNDNQQVIIAPRELDYTAVPDQAKTWVNEHLVYTHGYGFTLSPVNKVGEGGLPAYYVKDIGTDKGKDGELYTINQTIKDNISIENPRIYYGEITNNYIMTSTQVKELDYPRGEDNVYTIYQGKGGIKINTFWRKIAFAIKLKDWQMLFTENFTDNTRLLYRRNINERVRHIAPFLSYDHDPYLVSAKLNSENKPVLESNLYWIIDGYTTSDHYPYSDAGEHSFNYIRNSVKVVINAYNGDVNFYVADLQDPIIQSWQKILPNFFKSLHEMPSTLQQHIRYPEDLFSTQSERLLTYHMIDPQVFYNREDQWQIPQEIYGANSTPVEPYYLIMKLPTEHQEEFILLNPYTPSSRPNLIAWLAGRSDGQEYGKLLLYQFPKQRLIYGPKQIEALINQDPSISQQISLWTREGSKAIQGNLLIIPIEQSLLYVEPVYLEAKENSLPTLARVIVVYDNQIVMAETLQKALNKIFQS